MPMMLSVRKFLFILSIIVLGFTPALADECPEYLESGCDGGWAWFGLRHDGANVGQGQTVTLPCDTAVLSIDFMFHVTGNPNGGVPSMVSGDEIHVALMDVDSNIFHTATVALPADQYNDWITFSFPEGFIVPAGQYRFAVYTNVERQCNFAFCYGEGSDSYEGGSRSVSMNGIEGPWSEFGEGSDVPFQLYLEEGLVGTQIRTWDSVKGLYR